MDTEAIEKLVGRRVRSVYNHAADALVAASADADLVVLGTRGLHGIKSLGSVSERVAHEAASLRPDRSRTVMTMEVERPAVAGAPSPVAPPRPRRSAASPHCGPPPAPGRARTPRDRLVVLDPIRVRDVQRRLEHGQGGYEIVHQSEGLELGVYVLVAPEPDPAATRPGRGVRRALRPGTLKIADDAVSLEEGDAAFVPAGVEHRFTGYEGLSVLVVFAGGGRMGGGHEWPQHSEGLQRSTTASPPIPSW